MRTIAARTTPFPTYRSAIEAIRGSKEDDSKFRTVTNDQVSGKTIRRMYWDDAALTFELEGGQYLNVVAQVESVACSLEIAPVVLDPASTDDVVLLELNGRPAIEWRRSELTQRCIDSPLTGLWFYQRAVLVYTQQILLACNLIVSSVEAKPCLYWAESQ